jgi:hypothetical protein
MSVCFTNDYDSGLITNVNRKMGLNICTIIDLRNTDEIVAAYKYRTYEGAVALYSFFRIVLDTATSLKMKANTNSFYARSFDSVVRDLHYSPSTSSFSNSLYQSSSPPPPPPRRGRIGDQSSPRKHSLDSAPYIPLY